VSDEGTNIYSKEPLQTYLDDAASGKPAPGGGSVSACAGALGAALVSMVCNLTRGREKYADVDAQVQDLVVRSEAARTRLEQLLQDDTVAYNGVIEAYRLPKDTEVQRAARHQAVQDGLIIAANVPLEIVRVALEVCRLAKTAAEIGNPAAVTDAAIGAILGEAAVQGASLNVEINMGSIDDVDYVRRVGAELQEAVDESAGLRSEATRITLDKLPKRKDGHGRVDH
jgi:formiminotetrahydrofolate cyclodeaminase